MQPPPPYVGARSRGVTCATDSDTHHILPASDGSGKAGWEFRRMCIVGSHAVCDGSRANEFRYSFISGSYSA